jgi:hypothetical protein
VARRTAKVLSTIVLLSLNVCGFIEFDSADHLPLKRFPGVSHSAQTSVSLTSYEEVCDEVCETVSLRTCVTVQTCVSGWRYGMGDDSGNNLASDGAMRYIN